MRLHVESLEYNHRKNVFAMECCTNAFWFVTQMQLRLRITVESVDRIGRSLR